MRRARADIDADFPFLRACLLEAVRLWPTTPAILRQPNKETVWNGSVQALPWNSEE